MKRNLILSILAIALLIIAGCSIPSGVINNKDNTAENTKQNTFAVNTEISKSMSTDTFISVWKTDSESNHIRLPLVREGTYDFIVHWGDGNTDRITKYKDPAIKHAYSVPGTYTVICDGTIKGWSFGLNSYANRGESLKIIEIKQ